MRVDPPAGAPVKLRGLLSFAIAADAESTRAAAARLGVTPSWLVAQIRSLERGLGARLDRRERGRTVPTAAGRLLLERLPEVIESHERLGAAIAALTRAETQELRIGTSRLSGIVAQQVDFTQALIAAHPKIRLTVHDGDSYSLLDDLVHGRDDLSLALVGPHRQHRGTPLRTLIIRQGDPVVAGPAGHPLGQSGERLALNDLAGERIAAAPRTLGPDLFDRVHGPLNALGAEIHEQPEHHPRGLLHRVVAHRELTILDRWMVEGLLANDPHVWWRPIALVTDDLCLVRRPADDNPLAAVAWSVAEHSFGATG